jgi:hydrogenase/urease accessory protein HupE
VVRTLVLSVSMLVALAGRAAAHTVGLSTGEYTSSGRVVMATLGFARGEVAAIAPLVDADGDGHVTASEVDFARPQLDARVVQRIDVRSSGAACPGRLTDAALTELDGLVVSGRWDCPREGPFDVEVLLLSDLGRGHRHVARAVGRTTHDQVLQEGEATFRLGGGASGAATGGAPAEDVADQASTGRSFFVLGVEHILTGYDHLLFLFGLVLVASRLRSVVAAVTAFTVAHSITLALAVLGVWAPSSRIVEPAIALSIAYVGIENLVVKDARRRWRVTFPFGLVHGFGFAGALGEVALPTRAIPAALFSFNLGVEAGQLAVLVVVVPLLARARRTRWFDRRVVRALSIAIAIAGAVWFVWRVVSPG